MTGFLRRRPGPSSTSLDVGACGLLLFFDVASALAAERILAEAGVDARLVAPPVKLKTGCDLAIALARDEQPRAERVLCDAGVKLCGWLRHTRRARRLVDTVTTVDFDDWYMVRAGAMKITVEKGTGRIVNTSGGGCPDVPFLNLTLVGQTIDGAPRPRGIATTLCGLLLDAAFVECQRLVSKDRGP